MESRRQLNDFSWNQYLNEGKLMGSRCGECEQMFVPPRALCTKCHSCNLDWYEISGRGKLIAFTCIFVGPPSMVQEGYDRNNPYCVGVVELEEGSRVVARINGVDAGRPESICTDTPVKAAFLQQARGDNIETILVFEPM